MLEDFLDCPVARDVGAVDDRGMGLRVEVNQQRALARLRQAISKIPRYRGFADSPLLA